MAVVVVREFTGFKAFPNFHSNSSEELRNCPSRMLFPGNEFVKKNRFWHRKYTTFEDWTPSYQCLLNKKTNPSNRKEIKNQLRVPKIIQLTNPRRRGANMHEGLHLSLHCLHRHFSKPIRIRIIRISGCPADVQPMDGCMLKPENRHEISLFSPPKKSSIT